MLLVVQMHGEPGSGKSTLARALGPALHAVVLDKDIVKSALLRAGVSEALAGPASYEAYYGVAASLLRQGLSVVLDNPVYWPISLDKSRRLAMFAGARYALIECACPDRAELLRRLRTRDAMESQPRAPLDLDKHPGAAVVTTREPRLVLDTTRPLDDLVQSAIAHIEAHSAAPAAPATPPLPSGERGPGGEGP
ncbi:MAG: ATP-binding protein [Chloroflexota bacterium]|nr:ATP-binding protein [Chloroflexota bacterium]